uniref:Uncharacterized protein n=1 Tax=Arcella intermedia TaxID=1963864 RepID=A0A6B2L2Z7_9EUKA
MVLNSENFFYRFPLTTNRIKTLGNSVLKKTEILSHAMNTRIVYHGALNYLIDKFIEHKLEFGSPVERAVFQGMTRSKYINRLIRNRPLVFYTPMDVSILRNSNEPPGSDWRLIGTNHEGAILMRDYLSYDEIQLSTLLGVSSPTYFINNGNRNNKGVPSEPGTFEEYGIYLGLTGARFEHFDLMESQHVLVTTEYSTPQNGYGADGEDVVNRRRLSIWARVYHQVDQEGNFYFPSYAEVSQKMKNKPDPNFFPVTNQKSADTIYVNIPVYKLRLRLSLETLFLDANLRGQSENKLVYLQVIGLGLGSWQICKEQAGWLVDVCYEIIQYNKLPQISVLNFSWFGDGLTCGGEGNGGIIRTETGNTIKILFNKRNTADKLEGEYEGRLLVTCYPWDGNAFPGNEYWRGLLIVSGDPAAASCSCISELQNPYINEALNSNNIFVAHSDWTVDAEVNSTDKEKVPLEQESESSSI